MAEKIVATDCSRTKRTCPNSMTECDEKSKKMMANNIGKVKKIFFYFPITTKDVTTSIKISWRKYLC